MAHNIILTFDPLIPSRTRFWYKNQYIWKNVYQKKLLSVIYIYKSMWSIYKTYKIYLHYDLDSDIIVKHTSVMKLDISVTKYNKTLFLVSNII